MNTAAINTLLNELNNNSDGKLEDDKEVKIVRLLSDCWHEFEGADDTSMTPEKLWYAEDLSWNPPVLSFAIERHGAIVLGSKRADIHKWTINLDRRTAHCERGSYRQLYPNAKRLNVKPIVSQVIEAMQLGPASDCDLVKREILVWNGGNELSVKHGKLIPGGGYPQTVAGRRKRFRKELEARAKTMGWHLLSVQRWMTFARDPT